jgi:chitinase
MRQYLFDGLDIDWRYPVSGGQFEGRSEDRENFTLLLAELRAQLDEAAERDGRPYLLTMLVPAVDTLYANIEIDQVHRYVDWINLMAFGFHGEWSTIASHHAPLHANTRDPRGPVMQAEYNVDAVVNHFLDAGVPAHKLTVGIPFYAQTWRNVRQGDYLGLYQPADGVPSGTRPGGILYYRDMLPLLNNTSFVEFFDEETGVPWLFNPDELIAVSYEDARSIRNKVEYVRQRELGGVMVWQLPYDDPGNSLLHVTYTELTR